jgi:glycosyltransferase involved in cell wall biosynthesis
VARRILLVLPLLGGGAEICVELGAGLKRRGLEVEALVPSSTRAHALDAEVRLHYYDVPPFEPASVDCAFLTHQVLWGSRVAREAARLERDFDALLAHLPWGMATVLGFRRRRPLVGLIEVCWSDAWPLFHSSEPETAHPAYVNWRLARFLQERALAGCDRLVAPSAFLAGRYAGCGRAIEVIRYGRDPARFTCDISPEARARAKARIGVPVDRTLVLSVGYDFARKGHHHTAEVALRLREAGAHFLVLGPKPEEFRWWFEQDPTLASRLEVRADIPHQESPGYFAAADIFAFPSYFEGLPLSPLEAMASGVPILGQRAASLPEEVDDGVEGLLFPPGDVGAYEARLRALLGDPALRARMGEAGRARFLRDFTSARMVEEWASYLEMLSPDVLRDEAARGSREPHPSAGCGPGPGPIEGGRSGAPREPAP